MKNLILIVTLIFVSRAFAQDYTTSDCYKQFQEKAQAQRDKIKEKQESNGFGKKIAGFFCSLDKTTQLMMQQPGSAAQKLRNCDNPIDYRKQNDAQIILNLSYSEADNLKSSEDKNCHSQSPCDKSKFTLGGTSIVGSMEIAKDILTEAKSINSDITNWRFIQPIVQKGIESGLFCKKKPWSLRKIKRHIRAQVKNESIDVNISTNDSEQMKEINIDSSETHSESSRSIKDN